MKSLNKKINCRLASLCIPALFLAATDAFPETVNLYWSGGNASSDLNVTQANNWSVSPTEWTPPEKMDLANNMGQHQSQWILMKDAALDKDPQSIIFKVFIAVG